MEANGLYNEFITCKSALHMNCEVNQLMKCSVYNKYVEKDDSYIVYKHLTKKIVKMKKA